MKKYKNTIQSGSVRYIVFKEGKTWYATCLEFNITESGDDPREVLMLLFEAIGGYVSSVKKAKARPVVLNQKPAKEYEELWNRLQSSKYKKSMKSPYTVETFGNLSIA